MTVTPDTAGGARTPAIATIIASVCGFAFSMGLTYPVLSLLLDARGFSETEIGINAAFAGLGLLVSAFLIPRLAQMIGYRRLIIVSGATGAAVLVAMTVTEGLVMWSVTRFLLAICIAGLFVCSEAWMNELVDDRFRGRVMGIYAAIISIAFAAGPAMIPAVGFEPPTPFLICAAVVLFSGLVVMPLTRSDVRAQPQEGAGLMAAIRQAPIVLSAVLAMGFFEAAGFALLPVYVVERGFDSTHAALLVTAFAGGSVVVQPVIGWLADKAPPRRILLLSAGLSAVLCLAVPAVDLGHWGGFLLVGLLGGTGFGIYTLALTELGRRFKGAMLASAMACTAVAWGIGGIGGPAIAGVTMDAYGNDALMITMGSVFALLAVAAVFRKRPPD